MSKSSLPWPKPNWEKRVKLNFPKKQLIYGFLIYSLYTVFKGRITNSNGSLPVSQCRHRTRCGCPLPAAVGRHTMAGPPESIILFDSGPVFDIPPSQPTKTSTNPPPQTIEITHRTHLPPPHSAAGRSNQNSIPSPKKAPLPPSSPVFIVFRKDLFSPKKNSSRVSQGVMVGRECLREREKSGKKGGGTPKKNQNEDCATITSIAATIHFRHGSKGGKAGRKSFK